MISNKKIVFVLGMHRSGTSCLTGILKERGCAIGNFTSRNTKDNIKGNQENPDIYRLNERILKVNGGSWNKPKIEKLVISDRIKNKIVDLKNNLLESSDSNFYLIKDPRMIFCLPFWYNEDCTLIATIRHPSEVILSLRKRNNEKDIKLKTNWNWLWIQYNQRLLELYNEYKFPIVNFSWNSNRYRKYVNTICREKLKLSFTGENLPFLDRNLKHYGSEQKEIANYKTKELYSILSKIADNSIK